MSRKTFAQILKDANVDIEREYQRLFVMFYHKDPEREVSFRNICEHNFKNLPFKGTCISLNDFDNFYGFEFEKDPNEFNENYLINFCEYVYNLALFNMSEFCFACDYSGMDIVNHILSVMELIGYMDVRQDNVTIFVPKSQPAIVVAEMLPPDLSYKVIEYNHHSMKGDLARKQATLKLLADQLEAKRKELNNLNSTFSSDLFYLLNNMNIRHNNIDPDSTSYKKWVADMSEQELEEWYDRTYDLCLYAFMTLDQADHSKKIKELKQKNE